MTGELIEWFYESCSLRTQQFRNRFALPDTSKANLVESTSIGRASFRRSLAQIERDARACPQELVPKVAGRS